MQTKCGVYFVQLALKNGLPDMQKMSKEMGFTEKIDPTKGETFKNDRFWKQTEHRAVIAIYGNGHGVSASSPLQLNRFTSAIATRVLNELTIILNEPSTEKKLVGIGKINEQGLKIIRAGMIRSFSNEKVNRAEANVFKIAGITRTTPQDPRSMGALFTGYAPHHNPKYNVTVFLKEKKEKKIYGIKDAGGMAVEMFKVLLPL